MFCKQFLSDIFHSFLKKIHLNWPTVQVLNIKLSTVSFGNYGDSKFYAQLRDWLTCGIFHGFPQYLQTYWDQIDHNFFHY